jgi:hypothetical protein
MQTKFTVRQLHVFPKRGENTNVVGKVDWAVTFTRNGAASTGAGETLLDVDNLQHFISIDEVTEQLAIKWMLEKEGGDAFIERLQKMHESTLQYQEKMAGLVPWEFADKID